MDQYLNLILAFAITITLPLMLISGFQIDAVPVVSRLSLPLANALYMFQSYLSYGLRSINDVEFFQRLIEKYQVLEKRNQYFHSKASYKMILPLLWSADLSKNDRNTLKLILTRNGQFFGHLDDKTKNSLIKSDTDKLMAIPKEFNKESS